VGAEVPRVTSRIHGGQRNATRNQQRAATRSHAQRNNATTIVATSDATLATPRNATRSAAYVDTALKRVFP